ncbi:ABC transporter permease [Agaribacterium sp. ZY112]|uniref:ABC transporter permease n=1 Tax=Agaribacterium sp. ZY112 TaxID=3233574 RepID=UPI0035265715
MVIKKTALFISLQLAWRNLWRNKRRTAIMLAAISVGVWAMIFMSSLMRGMLQDSLQRSINALPGHVQIHHPDFRLDPSVDARFNEPSEALSQQFSSPLIKHWLKRINLPAVLASERETRGVQLLGIEPNNEQHSLSEVRLVEGRMLNDADDMALVIGQALAQRLDTRVGKRVVLMSQGADGELAERGIRIVGIYKSELGAQDERVIYLGYTAAQRFLKMPAQLTEIAFFADQNDDTDLLLAKVKSLYKQSASKNAALEILAWYDIDAYMASMMGMLDAMILVWILVVFTAMGFGLANTLLMAIFERIRELGLMMALGMPRQLVLLQIMFETCLMLLLGLLIGNSFALLSVAWTSSGIDLSSVAEAMAVAGVGSRLYPALSLADLVAANIVVLVLGLLTSILPAWRASHYDPVKALNRD